MLSHWSLVLRHSSLVLAGSLLLGHSSFAADVSSPFSPADAQKAFVLADSSLKIELAAAEPQTIDPVAIRFDEDSRMWVVEMRDYPLGNPEKGGEPLSKIRVLEDKDGDGVFETATTFADKLLFVTGLQPWKGGVFVTLAGRLAYMKDTDGDGRADVDETWFEGFAELNSQLRANHPRLALDNWIYVANGLRGGKVVNRKLDTSSLGDKEPINISGMDFRFDPLTGKCEAVTGNGQFGLCFDDWGNRFNCSNRNPVRHVVIEDRYLKANPNVTVSATVNDVAAFGEQSRIFPISRAWTTSNLHAGQFTAACGVYIYRGDLLPAEFKGNVFTCDPTGNLIHREIMQPAGPTFTSKPAYEGKEFLASPDEWFRPVNMELGPDGALYVVDMYRCVIEHPDFVPDELKRRPDLRLGDDRGRIWRIATAVPPLPRTLEETTEKRRRPSLSKLPADDLVSLLGHSNAWQRETAQRQLLERGADPLARRLLELVENGESPKARAHALWCLAGISDMNRPDLKVALQDSDEQIRRQALMALEVSRRGGQADISDLTRDPSALVRFQARLSARPIGSGQYMPRDFMIADADDAWMRRSILLSLNRGAGRYLAIEWLNAGISHPPFSAGTLALIEDLGELAAANDTERYSAGLGYKALMNLREPEAGLAVLRGAAKIWSRKKIPNDLRPALVPVEKLESLARDPEGPMKNRTTAVSLLAFAPSAANVLLPFVSPNQQQPIRVAAISALGSLPGAEHWRPLLQDFASDTPPIRRAIIDGLLANADRTKLLLDAIESGQVKTSEIDLAQVKRLITHRDTSIKDRAEKLFAAAMPADRAKALADYQPVLEMKGDAARGQAVFEKNCAACHRIAGLGVNVAPDISDSRTKKFDQLLADIIQPNRAIDNNYLGYTVRQLDGTVLTGILAAETATSITLRQQGGKEAVIPRSEIDELRSSGQSLMPEGLERQIPPLEMADLLAFIKNWRYLDGRTPLSDSRIP
jgi:putative membrane-bound dehydrogenase-like protein